MTEIESLIAEVRALRADVARLHAAHTPVHVRHGWVNLLVKDLSTNPYTQYRVHMWGAIYWLINFPLVCCLFFFTPTLWLKLGIFITLIYSIYASLLPTTAPCRRPRQRSGRRSRRPSRSSRRRCRRYEAEGVPPGVSCQPSARRPCAVAQASTSSVRQTLPMASTAAGSGKSGPLTSCCTRWRLTPSMAAISAAPPPDKTAELLGEAIADAVAHRRILCQACGPEYVCPACELSWNRAEEYAAPYGLLGIIGEVPQPRVGLRAVPR